MANRTTGKTAAKAGAPAASTTRKPARPAAKAGAHSPVDFYRPMGYAPEDSIGYLMRRILATVGQEVERQLEPGSLTNAQWVPLFKLYMGKGRTVAELARECELDAGAMTRLLDRLETKGLCRRMRSSEDRRVVNLELTPEGREVAAHIPGVLCRVQNAHLAGFTLDEWQALKGFLRRILDNALAIQANGEKREPQ